MIEKTFYINEIQEIKFCGQSMLYFQGGTFQLPYEIRPADGEHSLESCEGCQKQLKNLLKKIKSGASTFPNCCEGHKRLHLLKEFKIDNYKGLEESISKKILFTYHHVINHIDNDDWFADFSNYLEYVIDSFGSFPQGYGSPFQISNYKAFVIDMITSQKGNLTSDKISKNEIDSRLDQLLLHIENSFEPVDSKPQYQKNTDLNLVLATYDKWFKTFPFELSYFSHLKEKFSKSIPILKGDFKYNKYTGLSRASLHTKDSLTHFLFGLTKDIISSINGLKLYEKGLLTNVQNIKLELILKNRELELKELNSIDKSDKRGYIRVLKNWFITEKKFIEEISPLLKEKSNIENNEPKLTINQIALKLVYEGKSVTRANSNEVVNSFGHTSGDKLFNQFSYYSSTANRKGSEQTKKKFQNKIQLFESVIELLTNANKQRALDELSILKSSYQTLFE